jgi:hypothetical protein
MGDMKMKLLLTASASALVLAGCASYDGRGLMPGKSAEAEVVATMGTPAETLKRPNGDKVLFFPRLPLGRETYAAMIGPDGTLRGIDQVLTRDNVNRIAVNSTTRDQLRSLIGPPYRVVRAAFKPYDVWEYPWHVMEDRRMLWVSLSDDGVVREVLEIHDFESDPASGNGKDT